MILFVEDLFTGSSLFPAIYRYFLPGIMLVSTFFTTIIFLTVNNLYSTFASPIASEDGVAAGQLLNLTHALAKREFVPVDQLCTDPEHWLYRNCLSWLLDSAWIDSCLGDDDVEYEKLGSCPLGTLCMNTYSPPPDYTPTIICMARPERLNGNPSGNPPANGQVGSIYLSVANVSTPAISVELARAVKGAAVSAFIEGTYRIFRLVLTCRFLLLTVANYEGTDGNYLVVPHGAVMVGSVRETTQTACDYNVTNRDCVPAGKYDLELGNHIDFKFNLSDDQIVRFYYAIIAS
jgi:hypothetical protein